MRSARCRGSLHALSSFAAQVPWITQPMTLLWVSGPMQ